VQAYVTRRLLLTIPTLLLVSLAIFSMVRIIPGDVVLERIGELTPLGPSERQRVTKELGLDRPFFSQYGVWLGDSLRGDLGRSLISDRSVSKELLRTLPVSAELALLAILISLAVSIPLGILAAIRRNTIIDYGSRFFSILGLAVPDFWVGTVVVLGLAIYFDWSPPVGYASLIHDPRKNLLQFVLPSLILGLTLAASTARMTRSAMLEVLQEDYIRTAYSKGLRERTVVLRHALKNAFIPVITIIGARVARLVGGAIVLESIFSLPGVGRLTLQAVLQRDYTMIQGTVIFLAGLIIASNLIVDLCYAWLDPRIHYT